MWSSVYPFAPDCATCTSNPGITAAREILRENGDFGGVIGVDYKMGAIEASVYSTEFIDPDKNYTFFLMDQDGYMQGVEYTVQILNISTNFNKNLNSELGYL